MGADHAGFALKEKVKEELKRLGHRVYDFGTDSADSVDYPDYALKVAKSVANREVQRGILVCGTGIGMAISANKVPGVRAANVCDPAAARLSREHNDANVLTLGGRLLEETRALEIVRAWLKSEFAGGRHQKRVEKIAQIEQTERTRG